MNKSNFPGVLWILPVLFGIIGGTIAALISNLKYQASWLELFLVGIATSFLWAIFLFLLPWGLFR